MRRREIFWLAFEKFAIFFSFTVVFILVVAVLALAYGTWLSLPTLEAMRDETLCPTVGGLNTLLFKLENAVITRTIPISQTIPVDFAIYLDKNLNVQLTDSVQLSRPTTFVLPGGGGQINGTVYLALPQGQALPVHMQMTVPVSQHLPVQMQVPVAIPLKETDLGPVIADLRALLEPLRLEEMEELLACPPPQIVAPSQ